MSLIHKSLVLVSALVLTICAASAQPVSAPLSAFMPKAPDGVVLTLGNIEIQGDRLQIRTTFFLEDMLDSPASKGQDLTVSFEWDETSATVTALIESSKRQPRLTLADSALAKALCVEVLNATARTLPDNRAISLELTLSVLQRPMVAAAMPYVARQDDLISVWSSVTARLLGGILPN